MLPDDTVSLRYLPRRSSKNYDLQIANGDRFKTNYSVDDPIISNSLYTLMISAMRKKEEQILNKTEIRMLCWIQELVWGDSKGSQDEVRLPNDESHKEERT